MKSGMSLTELAAELQRRAEASRDFVTDSRNMQVTSDKALALTGVDDVFPLTQHADRQLGGRLKIPAQFYDRLRDNHPDLWQTTVNTLLQREPDKRMVRTLDGSVRAILGNSYQRIDNHQVAEVVLPVLMDCKELEIHSCNVTDRNLYLKAVMPAIRSEVFRKSGMELGKGHSHIAKGDVIMSAITISNSEIGCGSFSVSPSVFAPSCTNLSVFHSQRTRKVHLGSRLGTLENEAVELFTDETKAADDRALLLKVRDLVRGALDQEWFDRQVKIIQGAAEEVIEGDPVKAVEELAKADLIGFGKETQSNVLKHLIQGGDLSRWGLSCALTRASQDEDSYDSASDLEVAGGKVIELTPAEWRRVSTAA